MTESANQLAVLNRCGPYAGNSAQESLELVMAMSNFGQEVSVFFIEDGVYQLLTNQSPSTIGRKHFTKGFAALHFYDIENIYVCANSLLERGLTPDDLMMEAQALSKDEISGLLQNHKQVIRF
ncbi:sulfurtransferase complex subunit TusC [Flavobacterium sp. W21_SRS_FM6]|uniref:sulfurtransferase complex subunit TusC n=1 Tax=Flavobacterium sp. W21_SRS_FM6 TaxID=3240268 RepID=UPI003F8DCCCA